MTTLDAYTVVLAGGIGSRFWPASTPCRPKQLLPLAGPGALIEDTLRRARGLVGDGRVLVVTSSDLADAFSDLPAAAGARFLREPRARGTAPALAWAAHELARRDPECAMISLHADHRIEPDEGLARTLERALGLAARGYLVCVGAPPDRPEPGYGYVRTGAGLGEKAFAVDAFIEKPEPATAARYLAEGGYLWNTGIFVWRARDLLAALAAHAPEVPLGPLEAGDVEGFFESAAAVAIDVAVMERAVRVATVEAEFEWDDVGVWNALPRTRGTDAEGNAVVGSARLLDARDNVVWAESLRANIVGVSDLVIVEANGELLIMPRALAPLLGDLRTRLDETASAASEPGP